MLDELRVAVRAVTDRFGDVFGDPELAAAHERASEAWLRELALRQDSPGDLRPGELP